MNRKNGINMMYTHFVALFATSNLKIAYHFASDDVKAVNKHQQTLVEKLNNAPINISCNIHYLHGNIQPKDDALKSYDHYFEQYEFVSLDNFYKLALEESRLTIVDVAAYLKRKFDLNNAFDLQKNLYYMYADYLTENNKEPFEAQFVAFDQGPVDEKVYKANKYMPQELYNNFDFEQKVFNLTEPKEFLKFINNEVDKYKGKFYFGMPDNPTHLDNTPWSIAHKKGGKNAVITRDNILQNHTYELI